MIPRQLIKVWAVSFLLALSLVFMHIFMFAYSAQNTVLVTINRFGEADIELFVLVLVVMPIVSVGLALMLEDMAE